MRVISLNQLLLSNFVLFRFLATGLPLPGDGLDPNDLNLPTKIALGTALVGYGSVNSLRTDPQAAKQQKAYEQDIAQWRSKYSDVKQKCIHDCYERFSGYGSDSELHQCQKSCQYKVPAEPRESDWGFSRGKSGRPEMISSSQKSGFFGYLGKKLGGAKLLPKQEREESEYDKQLRQSLLNKYQKPQASSSSTPLASSSPPPPSPSSSSPNVRPKVSENNFKKTSSSDTSSKMSSSSSSISRPNPSPIPNQTPPKKSLTQPVTIPQPHSSPVDHPTDPLTGHAKPVTNTLGSGRQPTTKATVSDKKASGVAHKSATKGNKPNLTGPKLDCTPPRGKALIHWKPPKGCETTVNDATSDPTHKKRSKNAKPAMKKLSAKKEN